METVEQLFETRKNAVATKNLSLFNSTMISEGHLWPGTYRVYSEADSVDFQILSAVDDEEGYSKCIFVKEVFTFKQNTQKRFVLYTLVNTSKGWRIVSVLSQNQIFDSQKRI